MTIECNLCLEQKLDDEMYTFDVIKGICGHSFCRVCVKKMMDHKNDTQIVTCPTCRKEHYVDYEYLHINRISTYGKLGSIVFFVVSLLMQFDLWCIYPGSYKSLVLYVYIYLIHLVGLLDYGIRVVKSNFNVRMLRGIIELFTINFTWIMWSLISAVWFWDSFYVLCVIRFGTLIAHMWATSKIKNS